MSPQQRGNYQSITTGSQLIDFPPHFFNVTGWFLIDLLMNSIGLCCSCTCWRRSGWDRAAAPPRRATRSWTIWRRSARCRDSSADGSAVTAGKSSSKSTSNRPTPKTCARGTGSNQHTHIFWNFISIYFIHLYLFIILKKMILVDKSTVICKLIGSYYTFKNYLFLLNSFIIIYNL